MKLKPLGDRVILKPLKEEEKVKGGIIIPDTAKDKPQRGKVVAVGPGRLDEEGKRIPIDVKVGDSVIYSKYAGSEVKIDDEEYLILHDSDILAIIQ
ncbi:MAG: co-chaperone GroES [candidate division Zixibacteria bacterium 4484_93]|nr:MAG: co-chaperone GroES [candidate division Zixibacteria bacterium 4484_93]